MAEKVSIFHQWTLDRNFQSKWKITAIALKKTPIWFKHEGKN